MKTSSGVTNIMKQGEFNLNGFSQIVKRNLYIVRNGNISKVINNILPSKKGNYNLFKKNITTIPGVMVHTRNFRTIKNKSSKLKKNIFISKKNNKLPFSIYRNYGNNNERIDNLVGLINKYERELNFFKYTFIFNGILVAFMLGLIIYLLNSDCINSYIVNEIDKVVNEIKNSKKIQNNIKEVIENILYSIANEEENKKITSEFFVDVLSRSKGPMNDIFIKMFKEKEVQDVLKNTTIELSTYMSNNYEIQKNVYELLTRSMHHPEAIRISTNWLNNIFKSDSVTQHVRNVIYKEIFKNNEMKEHSINYMHDILLNTLESANSKEIVRLFLLSILSNPDFQNELSGSLWKILKLAVSPKWMYYDDIKVGLLNVKENPNMFRNKEQGSLHIETTNCEENKFNNNNISNFKTKNNVINKSDNKMESVVPDLNKVDNATNSLSNNIPNDGALKDGMKNVLQSYEQLDKEPDIIHGKPNKVDAKMNQIENKYNEDDSLYFNEKTPYLFSSEISQVYPNSLLYIMPRYKVYNFNELIESFAFFQYMKIFKTDNNLNLFKKYSEQNNRNIINDTSETKLNRYTFRELANLFIVDTLLFYSHKYYFYYYYVEKFKSYFINFRKSFIPK
ncbi:conserved Plasmodium protein, unknown function [Plasmodium vinckei vinckei]|uniref:Uncharacterized protein n=1 Tax=Plasmodium vinckei vinckei TaxID=54757 RepID=A0A449BQT9_PLAVN|nr:conserved Plasmodium protein, unknown function [Plasmodium vinckei vinckei]VEV55758.1 conserved Plasmodium protein, unknown function [Plasmodium vinckei vinckei]